MCILWWNRMTLIENSEYRGGYLAWGSYAWALLKRDICMPLDSYGVNQCFYVENLYVENLYVENLSCFPTLRGSLSLLFALPSCYSRKRTSHSSIAFSIIHCSRRVREPVMVEERDHYSRKKRSRYAREDKPLF